MKRPSRPLWKFLIVFSEPEPTDELNCADCFNVLQRLASEAAKGLEEKYLQEAMQTIWNIVLTVGNII